MSEHLEINARSIHRACQTIIERDQAAVRIEAETNFRGDPEKVSTAVIAGATYRSVSLSSRYNKAHEYKAMIALVGYIPDRLTEFVDEVFCDSKASHVYEIILSSIVPQRELSEIVEYFRAAGEAIGGYNGIHFLCQAADMRGAFRKYDLDPCWPDSDL
jgi:anaerobic glycerol-3-phosphate dehydrogenase